MLILKEENEALFRELIGDRISKFLDVVYGTLLDITERIKVIRRGGQVAFTEDELHWMPLDENIPDFHNAVSRFAALREAVRQDRFGRAAEARREINYALAREERRRANSFSSLTTARSLTA